jgi:hypothetical protein
MTKEQLVEALAKMVEVGTKGIKTDYEKAFRVTIKVDDDKVNFLSSNGLLDAHWEVTSDSDENLKCEDQGSATVDVAVARKIVASIGGSAKDNIIIVSLEGDASPSLHMKDADAKGKKFAKMVTFSEGHDFHIAKPQKGFTYLFESEEFQRGIATAGKYVARRDYLPRYMMMCLHFLKNETRFVCGDGSRFGILGFQLDQANPDIDDDAGKKFILPCDQAQIIASLCASEVGKDVQMTYKNEQTCYIKPQESNLTLLLHGIPNDQYISYEKHAFNFDDAKTVIDLKRDDFEEGMLLIGAVEDKERNKEGGFHHCDFVVKNGKAGLSPRSNFIVKEARFQADFDCDATVYGESDYASCYAHEYLKDVAQASDKPIIRFYCIDPERTIIVEPVDPDDGKKDVLGAPGHKDGTNNPRLSFFFAAAADDEEDE